MNLKENIIEYNGVVKLEIFRGETKIKTMENKNSGTVDLYKYLCRVLQGLAINSARPMYIMPLIGDEHTEAFSGGVACSAVTGPSSDEQTYASVTYTFVLPGTLFSGRTITGFRLKGLSGTTYVTYAESLLTPESYVTLSLGDNLTASWVVTFGGAQ